ncbi:alpha-glucan family phosphorylase [Motilibacter deserti]|uniref:glycogen phosphorylase n=1 Tax=Motilibacter deserti TaxID=2714956 RepID=A0ABX0GRF9_9ACTN|nr:glycosyltransferase family 1 protein [Motilibacter deserti]
MRAIRRFTVRTVLPEALAPLGELSMNLRWSWHPETQDLFRDADPATWEAVGHDPVALLGALAPERLAELAGDEGFVRRVHEAAADLREYLTGSRWYQSLGGDGQGSVPAAIAYFSPEYGITSVLPQYSGGLGILAGDHLKSASDLGVPIVGVGLLYRSGYFRQSLSGDGWQQEHYPVLDPDGMPISVLREPDGSPLVVTLDLPGGRALHARVWVAQVGRVPLLLLDSDIETNEPAERQVTERLYGGGNETRLLQELLLGMGGVRALRAYSRITGAPAPDVFHTNEGHAGFLGIERIRELVADAGLSFDEALEAVRAGTVFTTHTPVPAGIDRFPRDLVAQHFSGPLAPPEALDRILALGAETYEGGDPGVFNMAVMGLRLGQRANGVSLLHGEVSRGMFSGLWPGFDPSEVPITSVTNGVHAPTWVAREALDAAEQAGGARDWEGLSRLSDSDLWGVRRTLREKLVTDARRRLRASWLERGASEPELGWIDSALDPDVLTIGFARRVPSYKRLTLMLRDPARLKSLLLHPERPIQIIVAGKAHPADEGGKRLIQELVRFTDDPEVRHRIVFLPNYDIAMAQTLLPGTDVWLNNPLRPLEASGTSGMKAALNGGLNLSILDGWWDEWFDGENGWAIPTADGVNDPNRRDDLEAAGLYDLIETQVASRFYDRGHDGVPQRWIQMVRHTLQSLGPKVLASRQVQDYVNQLYLPAATSVHGLGEDLKGAKVLAEWKRSVRGSWDGVRVDHVESEGVGDAPEVGAVLHIRAFVSIGALQPGDVEVQLVHGRVDEGDELTDTATLTLDHAEAYEGGRHRYDGELTLERTGAFGYTVRVLPSTKLAAAPAELGLVANAVVSEGLAKGAPPLR